MPRLLNIGCGSVFDPKWENIDLMSCAPEVRAHDILSGLPAADNSLDGVYSSHVLEHLTQAQAEDLLREVWRALRPDGVIRIVVPDLEGIVRAYLHEVDQLRAGRGNLHRHRWMLVELLDQMTRTRSGGEYGDLIRNYPEEDLAFAEGRLGRSILYAYRVQSSPTRGSRSVSLSHRLRSKLKRWLSRRLGVDLEHARFRASGEIHQWMYDAFNLTDLLKYCGFVECAPKTADRSDIPGWANYALDRDHEGRLRKPDSLFMEARKPGT